MTRLPIQRRRYFIDPQHICASFKPISGGRHFYDADPSNAVASKINTANGGTSRPHAWSARPHDGQCRANKSSINVSTSSPANAVLRRAVKGPKYTFALDSTGFTWHSKMFAKRHIARFVNNYELALKTTDERTGYLSTLISVAGYCSNTGRWFERRTERLGV